jgi:hypothetical protein
MFAINLGNVVEEGERNYGDAVNIASPMELPAYQTNKESYSF